MPRHSKEVWTIPPDVYVSWPGPIKQVKESNDIPQVIKISKLLYSVLCEVFEEVISEDYPPHQVISGLFSIGVHTWEEFVHFDIDHLNAAKYDTCDGPISISDHWWRQLYLLKRLVQYFFCINNPDYDDPVIYTLDILESCVQKNSSYFRVPVRPTPGPIKTKINPTWFISAELMDLLSTLFGE